MRERPILFSAPMVRALLAGTKTQTRRIVKPQPELNPNYQPSRLDRYTTHPEFWWPSNVARSMVSIADMASLGPYGSPGDRLWVRETWYCDDHTAGNFKQARIGYVSEPPTDAEFIEQWRDAMDYRATHDCNMYEDGCPCRDDDGRSAWRPSIHMPRWASRITLEVTKVRVERLHAITEDDARAEGVQPFFERFTHIGRDQQLDGELCLERPYRSSFKCLWDEINGDRALWVSNPFVWVVEFRRLDEEQLGRSAA